MKLKELVSVLTSATCITLMTGEPDEDERYLGSFGTFEGLLDIHGEKKVVAVWPANKDVVEVFVEV